MDGVLEFFPQGAGMFGVDTGDEHRLAVFEKFGGDFDDLFRRLARAKNDFGKIFAQARGACPPAQNRGRPPARPEMPTRLFRAEFFRREIGPASGRLQSLSSQDNASRNTCCHAGKLLYPPEGRTQILNEWWPRGIQVF